ncbi:Protein of unknown function (DUF3718) [Idiomarina sp. A28L]|uniref:DUF3718 domain-containing protein n=1 Tax=Idiomarina sp. A28L TaxID=1036674 RepID=UPI000213870A|nr:DUF3718 domain-containing protein [Idiomarina sp. A28L]EGN75277.1 Protein of unknown function (DUF3718) [Idiomarina sp. A28L]
MTRWLIFIAAYFASIPSHADSSADTLNLDSFGFTSAPASRPVQSFGGESVAKEICYSISADNRREFQNILDRNGLRIRNMYTAIKCNGYSLLQFAVIAEATDTGMLLTRSLPARMILEENENGDSILEWAETTGYHNSPIIRAVRERLPQI